MIAIIDYGMCNLGSILNMFKKIGVPAKVCTDSQEISRADKIILPGVGAFDTGMKNLANLDIIDALNQRVLNDKIPVLGICLGMQLLMRRSEEGQLPGLGWIDGDTVRFRSESFPNLKVPHMGWNTTTVCTKEALFNGLEQDARFYFVHTFHVACDRQEDVLAMTNHGYDFASAVRRGNIFGTQFHPEKSHKFGMRLLKNFTQIA